MNVQIDWNHVPPLAPESDIPCCMGSAVHGPERCTCWEPVYDLEQAPLQETIANLNREPDTRSKCCEDCAYRLGSTERERGDADVLMGHALDGRSEFWCHQGSRRILAYVHPDGRRAEANPGDYDPPTTYEPRPLVWKADGTPQERCAGWAALRRSLTEEA